MQHLIRYVFTSDWQCPDHNKALLKPLYSFIRDFKPDHFVIVGDFVNFTSVSKYDVDPHYAIDFVKEIRECRKLLTEIVSVVRSANSKSKIDWDEGNHELRLIRYLIRNAKSIALLEVEEEEILSIPYLFELKKLGIDWYPMTKIHTAGDMLIEHGEIIRKRAGDTAKSMLDARNRSGISGHTHRAALHMRTTGSTQWWIENGSLCNLQPTPPYVKSPDWQNAITVGIYDKAAQTMHPTLVPIINNSFTFGEKLYK